MHLSGEFIAALVLVVGGALFVVRSLLTMRAGVPALLRAGLTDSSGDIAGGSLAWIVVGAASVGAAIIHLALAPAHFDEIGPHAIGFLVAGLLQMLSAFAALARRTRPVAVAIVALNGGLVIAWLVSRTLGLPIGAPPWHPEAVGRADLITVALEMLIVTALAGRLVPDKIRRPRLPSFVSSIAAVPAAGGVFILTIVALAAGEAQIH